jgi:3-oxoacyl-[acyl-carrier-protein] synthase II
VIPSAGHLGIASCGVVSAVGVGWEAMARALVEGRSGVAPAALFDTRALRCHTAAEIRDFDPHAFLAGKPLRGMSRSAHLACSAVSLALGDGGVAGAVGGSCADPARTGIVAGTVYGNVNSVVRFDVESQREGPRFVDATLFPNTVINSPAGFASIYFNIAGSNTTISGGISSSFAAIDYAAGLLASGSVDSVLAGGFEELSQWVYLGLHNGGRLAGSRAGDSENGTPFDRRRTGFVLGEGAAFVRLVRPETVQSGGRAPLAWIAGRGSAFVPGRLGEPEAVDAGEVREAMARAMREAIAAAHLSPADVDVVWASASGSRPQDALEAAALGDVFGPRAEQIPIAAAKGSLGECFGASGALQIAGALLTLREGLVPPTPGFIDTDCVPPLGGVCSCLQRIEARHVLVNAFDGLGNNASLLLSRAE